MPTKKAIRVANCSGSLADPAIHMYNQAKYGNVDVITGDYLAEMNLADQAEAMHAGENPGYIPSALEGIRLSLDIVNEKRIKIIVNGGGLNPKGLAEEVYEMVAEKGYGLKVAYVNGDDLLDRTQDLFKEGKLSHFDSHNNKVRVAKDPKTFLSDPSKPVVSANAYLGCRAIERGLKEGADIIICGRVADASPVIAAAKWWYAWSDESYDELAGAFVAGHLIECSFYSTGANFAGFYTYKIEDLLNLAPPIAEIFESGDSVITKPDGLNGHVTEDTVKCQLLYEIQGNIYLNSDVKADISNVSVKQEAPNRVYVTGAKGYPPPPTTKLAVFYHGGYQCELLVNGCGYAINKKYDLTEAQIKAKLREWNVYDDFELLDFQRIGVPAENPRTQLSSTTYLRIFAQAATAETLQKLHAAFAFNSMQHFAGQHGSLERRGAAAKRFRIYFPALIEQREIQEAINIIAPSGVKRIIVGPPSKTEPVAPRENYNPANPVPLESFGPTKMAPLGDIALARSGDKGANINIGIFVHTDEEWEWLRSFMTRETLQDLMGDDWRDWYFIERVELPRLRAVNFVIYGPLGSGVSSSAILDCLGKGFSEHIRWVHVPIPTRLLNDTHAD